MYPDDTLAAFKVTILNFGISIIRPHFGRRAYPINRYKFAHSLVNNVPNIAVCGSNI